MYGRTTTTTRTGDRFTLVVFLLIELVFLFRSSSAHCTGSDQWCTQRRNGTFTTCSTVPIRPLIVLLVESLRFVCRGSASRYEPEPAPPSRPTGKPARGGGGGAGYGEYDYLYKNGPVSSNEEYVHTFFLPIVCRRTPDTRP